MRTTNHQRVLQAARSQLATYNQAAEDVSGLVRVARKPLHVFSLWVALWRWGAYAMRWLFLYLDLSSVPGLGAWSSERRQVAPPSNRTQPSRAAGNGAHSTAPAHTGPTPPRRTLLNLRSRHLAHNASPPAPHSACAPS